MAFLNNIDESNRIVNEIGNGLSLSNVGVLTADVLQSEVDAKQDIIDVNNRLNAGLIGDGLVSNTEFSYLNNLTSNISSQLGSLAFSVSTKLERPLSAGLGGVVPSLLKYNQSDETTSQIQDLDEIITAGSGITLTDYTISVSNPVNSNTSILNQSSSLGLIGHSGINNLFSSGKYALLYNSDGTTYLNGSASSNSIRFRINGTDKAFFNENGNFVLSTANFQPERLCNQGAYYCLGSLIRGGGFILERDNGTYEANNTTRSWVYGLENTTGSSTLVWKFNNQTSVSNYDTHAGDIRMRLTLNGNLGIGTSSDPQSRLVVEGGDFRLEEGRRIVLNANSTARIFGTSAGKLEFFSGANSAVFTMACDGSNRLGIGTGSPDEKVRVIGNVKCNSLIETSDDRLKDNEEYIENALDTIMKLKPQIYDKYDDFSKIGTPTKEAGLISQEVYYLAPELRHIVKLGKDKKTRKLQRTYKIGQEETDIDQSGNEIIIQEAIWKTDEVDEEYDEILLPQEIDLSNHDIKNDLDYSNLGWSKNNPSSISYTELIPYLIKGIQEQNILIENLNQRIKVLEA